MTTTPRKPKRGTPKETTDGRRADPDPAVAADAAGRGDDRPGQGSERAGSPGPVDASAQEAAASARKPKSAAQPITRALPRLGVLEAQVLVALPCISVTELAERLDVTRPSASRALHRLHELGLVQADGGGTPGWKTGWVLTDQGRDASGRLSWQSVRKLVELLESRARNLPEPAEAVAARAADELRALIAADGASA